MENGTGKDEGMTTSRRRDVPLASNVGMPSVLDDKPSEAASHRSEEPVSRITLYEIAGVPTAIEP